jgi:hypothetical protein
MGDKTPPSNSNVTVPESQIPTVIAPKEHFSSLNDFKGQNLNKLFGKYSDSYSNSDSDSDSDASTVIVTDEQITEAKEKKDRSLGEKIKSIRDDINEEIKKNNDLYDNQVEATEGMTFNLPKKPKLNGGGRRSKKSKKRKSKKSRKSKKRKSKKSRKSKKFKKRK